MESSPTVDWRQRVAARVLLVDSRDRVLMFRGFDPADPDQRYWFTPGGGLDPGETFAQAAARELAEETGLRLDVAQLGEPVHTNVVRFYFDGVAYEQKQQFFLVRVDAWEVDTSGFDEIETAVTETYHWWSTAELAQTHETVHPEELMSVLRRLGVG